MFVWRSGTFFQVKKMMNSRRKWENLFSKIHQHPTGIEKMVSTPTAYRREQQSWALNCMFALENRIAAVAILGFSPHSLLFGLFAQQRANYTLASFFTFNRRMCSTPQRSLLFTHSNSFKMQTNKSGKINAKQAIEQKTWQQTIAHTKRTVSGWRTPMVYEQQR